MRIVRLPGERESQLVRPYDKSLFHFCLIASFVLHLGVLAWLAIPASRTASRELRFARPGTERQRQRFEIRLVRPLPVVERQAAAAAATADAPGTSARDASRFPSDVVRRENLKIQNSIRYPELARKMNWQGDVVLAVTVDPAGHAAGVAVLNSSGHAILDRAAREGAAKHFFGAGATSETIRLRFSFRLRGPGI